MEKKVENSKLEDNRGNLVLECRKKTYYDWNS